MDVTPPGLDGHMKTYLVRVQRDGNFWVITVPEIDCVTQARFPGEIEYMARDLIAVWLEVEPDSFDVTIEHVE